MIEALTFWAPLVIFARIVAEVNCFVLHRGSQGDRAAVEKITGLAENSVNIQLERGV